MAKKSVKKAESKIEPKKLRWSDKEPDKGGRITYQTDGNGKWWKRVSAIRCTEEVFMHGQCQGVDGHDGLHWCYSECGSFCWDDNEYDPKEGGCSGTTPPDHEKYQSPQDMMKLYHGNLGGDWEEVVDIDLIAKLEADDVWDDNVGVIRPVTNKKSLARLKRIKKENAAEAKKFMKGKPRPKNV